MNVAAFAVGGNSKTFNPRIGSGSIPIDNKYYISDSISNAYGKTGYNPCAVFRFADSDLNVMPNCVGYAIGRFNEIINAGNCHYNFNGSASNFIKKAKSNFSRDITCINAPSLGGIMVWSGGDDGSGHVAVVEAISEDGKTITISESCYGRTRPDERFWRTRELTKSSNWACFSGYNFIGCICNPAVTNNGDIGGPLTDQAIASIPALEALKNRGSAIKGVSIDKHLTNYNVEYRDVSTDITRDKIATVDSAKLNRVKSTNLLSYPSLVESPFVIVKIGDYTFGDCHKDGKMLSANGLKVDYPNYIQSLNVSKVNGTINQYTISMVYQIREGDDPNKLSKIFSTVGYGKIKISYGDWMSPMFIYKEEEALILKLVEQVDFAGSRINYTLSCVSDAVNLLGGYYDFPQRTAKPSTVITDMLRTNTYGITDIFYGMKNMLQVESNNLIPKDDKEVTIQAKNGIDPLSYINYLVTCMSSNTNSDDDVLRDSAYYMSIVDDTIGERDLIGPYFKITKVNSTAKTLATIDTYEVDIGYPSDNLVTNFSLRNDNSWSLLYNYADKVADKQDYTYKINDKGEMITIKSPSTTTSSTKYETTESQKYWWTQMTQFPISATMEIKGLVRPAMLMTYVRVNALFYGQRHISSGLYIITKQEDTVDSRGYKTVLTLSRIAGDNDYITTTTETYNSKVAYYVKG